MKDKTLVIMAAGMGSRFGGLKQIEPIDDDDNFILDYSIFDAKRSGFNKVVLIIKKENKEIFDNTIKKRWAGLIDIEYVFQDKTDIPVEVDLSSRVKPLGTGQAIYCARDAVEADFVVINSDDFYGYDAFMTASKAIDDMSEEYRYTSIAYPLLNSSWGNEVVKRGIVKGKDGVVNDIIESSISINSEYAIAKPLNGDSEFNVDLDSLVSMNMFAFKRDIYDLLEEYMVEFFSNQDKDIMNEEILLPEVLRENIKAKRIKLDYVVTNSLWMGITYREDLDRIKDKIVTLKNEGVYPLHLNNK